MEKQQPSDCDSMTTVTVKDYTPGMEYPDPPPSYRGVNKQHPMVQVAKIAALTAIIITSMLSASIIVSAWISSSNGNTMCQYPATLSGIETVLEPQSLQSAILIGSSDLDSSESKIDASTNKPLSRDVGSTDAADRKSGNSVENSDEDGGDSAADDDDEVTMLKLPLELNLQEHMFEKLNHRSNMNCVIEKKRAEEVVDEHSKPLPSFLGMNLTTDPRYLRFTGEKMIVSCGSDDPQPRIMMPQHEGPPPPMPMPMGHAHGPFPHPPMHPLLMDILHGSAPAPMLFPPPPHQATFSPQSPFQATLLRPALPFARHSSPQGPSSPSGSPSNNIHMIGPIPLSSGQNPLELLLQHVLAESQNDPMLSASQPSINSLINNNNEDESAPQLIPTIFIPQSDSSEEIQSSGPIFFPGGGQEIPSSPMQGRSIQFQLPGSFLTNLEPQEQDSVEEQIPARQIISEILQRERAAPNPVPIQPRHHIQHVIRPRRSADEVKAHVEPANVADEPVAAAEKKPHNRVKRCSCDCACKNHNPLKE